MVMGSWTPRLCFSVFAAAEENLHVSAEEVSELLESPPFLTLTRP